MVTRSITLALAFAAMVGACCPTARPDSHHEKPAADGAHNPAGGFVPARDVDAVDQPDGHRVVARLVAGRSYSLQKRGGPNDGWTKVETGAGDGWVKCAESSASAPAPTAAPPGGPHPAPAGERGSGRFAYYVLTLSWSPAFCETPAGARSPEQCSGPRHYGFVVHGLWPQNETGWPESCAAGGGPAPALVSKMLDIMPSRKLVEHEWEKHGTCSGLSAEGYFEKVRAALGSIRIPEAYVAPKQAFSTDMERIVSAFVAANPGLSPEKLAVQCKRELDEVRICLDKDLAPRAPAAATCAARARGRSPFRRCVDACARSQPGQPHDRALRPSAGDRLAHQQVADCALREGQSGKARRLDPEQLLQIDDAEQEPAHVAKRETREPVVEHAHARPAGRGAANLAERLVGDAGLKAPRAEGLRRRASAPVSW
jgi:ribonuclease T2